MRMFFGSCQDVSGNDWWDNPEAPWNKPDAVYEACPDCKGDGGVYYNEDGDELSKSDYESLNDEDKVLWGFDECRRCDGFGTIRISDYEEVE